ESVPGELELERGDVPAEGAPVEHATADRVPPVAAERAAGALPGHAVRREPGAALEAPDRGLRGRAEDAVDRVEVDPLRAQGRLESRDARAPLTPGRPCEEQRGCGGKYGSHRHGSRLRRAPSLPSQ